LQAVFGTVHNRKDEFKGEKMVRKDTRKDIRKDKKRCKNIVSVI
jgi:hypothetical protein